MRRDKRQTGQTARYFLRPSFVLTTESESQLDALRGNFRKNIDPQDTIERMYCDDICDLVWEISRYRRHKTAIQKLAFRNALYLVLVERLGILDQGQETVEHLDRWFHDDNVKEEVKAMLARFDLDLSSIEAEAFRVSANEIAQLEFLIASLETRRDKALSSVKHYREELGQKLNDKVIELLPDRGAPRFEKQKRLA